MTIEELSCEKTGFENSEMIPPHCEMSEAKGPSMSFYPDLILILSRSNQNKIWTKLG